MISRKILAEVDGEISRLIQEETKRKEFSLELIPSENCVSEAVLEATGSILTDKYCEGYPGKRYYGGCGFYDQVETIAQERSKQLFGAEFSNVQPHSGANANMAALLALVPLGETIMGPRLDHGGHLTHGSPVNFSGKFFKVVGYGVHPETEVFDEAEIMRLAREHRPKLIICGMTAYSRQIDWAMFRRAADEVGAFLMADIAHYSGLIAGGAYDNPVSYVDLITSTTHKTLRGPRGGMILGREIHEKAVNKMVFPGLQGGPLMHQIAGKAVAFLEALQPEFQTYAKSVVANARELSTQLAKRGFRIVSGGTDSHLMLLDLRQMGVTGAEAENALGAVGITVNKNTIPNDPAPPLKPSGIRLGTPAITTRGFGLPEMSVVADCIHQAITYRGDELKLKEVRQRIIELCQQFPLFPYRLK